MSAHRQPANQNQPQPGLQRIRLYFARGRAIRYVSHLDMHKVWERTLRRAGLPLAYSQGFSPQPRMHQACSLPLGFLSQAEIIDFWLEQPLELEQIRQKLENTLPPGINIQTLEQVDLHVPALQTVVRAAEYEATLLAVPAGLNLNAAVADLLEKTEVIRQWRGKTYDLRPLIETLEVLPSAPADQPRLYLRLSAREGATGRPEELLSALGLDPFAARVERKRLIL